MKGRWIGMMCLMAIATKMEAQVSARLQELGMENIQEVEVNGNTIATYENKVYRGTVRGVGKAIEAGLSGMQQGSLQLVALDNDIPQLLITLPAGLVADYKSGKIAIDEVYRQMGLSNNAGTVIDVLKEDRTIDNASAWKTDVVLYPEVVLQNFSFDKLFSYAVNLAPAVELTMWRGAKLTAQVVFPIATNMMGNYKRIRPGIMALSQEMQLSNTVVGRVSIGNFTNNRIGAQAELNYRSGNGRMELGAKLGTTGYSGIEKGGWYIGKKQYVNATVSGAVYVPQFQTQLKLQADRYLYGDYGVRGDCTRHFGEHAVGVYAMYVEGEINGGFHFAIPLPGKKRPTRKRVRVMQPEYFDWEYSMTPWGKYFQERMGRTFDTRPNENRSEQFFQPEFIRYFLLKEAAKEK